MSVAKQCAAIYINSAPIPTAKPTHINFSPTLYVTASDFPAIFVGEAAVPPAVVVGAEVGGIVLSVTAAEWVEDRAAEEDTATTVALDNCAIVRNKPDTIMINYQLLEVRINRHTKCAFKVGTTLLPAATQLS
jgi:hypothetical protein